VARQEERVANYLLMTVSILAWCYSHTFAEDTKPTITPIESTGIYFDEIGNVFFYPTRWKIVSYVDLKPTQRLWKQVKIHQFQILNYCNKVQNTTWYQMTDCSGFTPYIRTKTRHIEQLKDVVVDYLALNSERTKRGLLDVGGDIFKFLFGTLTQSC
jgi:hypothetical protein